MGFSLKQFLLETLFPLYCLGCKEEGHALCHSCAQSSFGGTLFWFCPKCLVSREVPGACAGHVCALDGIAALTAHHQPLLRRSLHTLKYGYIEQVASAYGEALAGALARGTDAPPFFGQSWTVVPVPLHRKRLVVRDFNQSERMCEAMVARIPSLGYAGPLLTRVRHTQEQARLNREERLENVAGAFVALAPVPAHCLLIDDVSTTGATLQECAGALKAAGAAKVYGVVMAHG